MKQITFEELQIKSESKLLDLYNKLDDEWKVERWNLLELPITTQDDRDKIISGKALRYLKFNCSPSLAKELKVVIWKLLHDKVWRINTLAAKAGTIHSIMNWLDEKKITHLDSILLEGQEYWDASLRAYMIEIGKYSISTRTMLDANQQIRTYPKEHMSIYILHQIIKVITEIYDNTSEFDKDIWDIRRLGLPFNNTIGCYTLSFASIKQSWLKELSKKFLRNHLARFSFSNAANKLSGLKQFSKFLSKKNPTLELQNMDQSIFSEFSIYLTDQELSYGTRQLYLCAIRDFFSICAREKWIDFKEPIYMEKIRYKPEQNKTKFISEYIMQQLNRHIVKLRPDITRLMLLLQVCGMRISEALTLPLSCLSRDHGGDYILTMYQFKLRKEHSIPVSIEIVNIIEEQKIFAKELCGNRVRYLFPNKRGTPILQKNVNENVNRMAYEMDIRDEDGNLFHFHAHQLRHTVGTNLINIGVPQHIVQKYLGHETPEMTNRYAHIHDQSMKRKFLEFKGQLVDIYGHQIKGENDLQDISELKWLKKNVLAQTLSSGYCSIPIIAGPCPHANACLSCDHFRTDRSFLDLHLSQLKRTEALLAEAEKNNWIRQIEINQKVLKSLQNIIQALNQ